MTVIIIAFFAALIISITLTPAIRRLALRWGFVDRPGPRKIHLTPMPLLGGLAIYTGVFLAITIFIEGEAPSQVIGILGGGMLLAVVGLLDERKLLHNQFKLLVAMPAVAIVLIVSGIWVNFLTMLPSPIYSEFVVHMPDWLQHLANYALTLVWVVGITAAFSILDHMDGLCSGVAAVASLFFLVFAYINGQILVGTWAAALLGATLGFLRWNFNPAMIFMGDGGAMFLGFMMATLGLKLRFPQTPSSTSWMIPVLILAIPIFDTTLIILSRVRRKLIPFASPGKDHTAHRLANLGLGNRGAVLLLYGVGALLGGLALAINWLPVSVSYVVFGVVVLLGVVGIVLLERAPFERQVKEKRDEVPSAQGGGSGGGR